MLLNIFELFDELLLRPVWLLPEALPFKIAASSLLRGKGTVILYKDEDYESFMFYIN